MRIPKVQRNFENCVAIIEGRCSKRMYLVKEGGGGGGEEVKRENERHHEGNKERERGILREIKIGKKREERKQDNCRLRPWNSKCTKLCQYENFDLRSKR